ncbi:MAG TPA: tetratricopeptide repeat protein [Candidatus Saccharimonadales bacterium]|nr:tetratricopeptide repeat protein [Candidatus Saccharimonadales bacterium]
MIGRTLGHYQVIEKIGEGGMGVVYRARDQRLERDVALKVLPAGILGDPAARKRFRNEALALARLNHPNICSVFDFNAEGDSDFLVMEFVPGISLHEKLEQGNSTLAEVVPLGLQVSAGLAVAHEQGVIHRDLKPANLRVTPDGRLKILDFGLAKFFHPEAGLDATLSVADTSSFSGTVPYMAPEQLRGEPPDARTDIYAVGAVLYELATGRRPFPEPQLAKLIDAILNNDPTPAARLNRDVTPALESVLQKALAHSPGDRYQSARELHADLERLSNAQTPLAGIKSPRPSYRASVGLLLSLLVVGSAIGWYVSRRHNQLDPEASGGFTRSGPARPGSVRARRSVAVFAIKNLSGRPDSAWLSTALSEMLTTELAAGERLRTIPGETISRAKLDLSLSDTDTFAQDTLRRINASLGTDAVLSGSYVVIPGATDGKIRVDLRIQDSHSGEIISSVSETGTQSELLDVVSRAGAKLRTSLGAPELSADDAGKVLASLPTSSDAARLYAEGLNKLRVYDSHAAKDLLEEAAAADPANVAIHTALASAWGQLGFDSKVLEQSKKALDLSANLSREERFAAEGRYQSAVRNWPKVIEIYQSLFNVFPDNPEYGIQLAIAQSSAGKPQDSFATLDKLRATIPSLKDDPRVDIVEASTADRTADFKRELAAATRAADRAKSRGERLTAARALLLSGWALQNLGDVEKATSVSLEAKAAYEAAGDRVGVSRALHNLALIHVSQGKLDQAETDFNQAIAIRRQIQDNQGLCRALNDLALVHERRGDLVGAQRKYLEGLAIAQQISDKGAIAAAYVNLSNLLIAQGKSAESRKYLGQALTIFRQMGNKQGIATCLANLGNATAEAGDSTGARKLYDEAASNFADIGQKAGLSQVRTLIAGLFLDDGDYVSARSNYEQALAAARDVGDPLFIADAESGSSKAARLQGDWPAARAHAESAVAAAKTAGDKRLLAITDYDFAASLEGQGDVVASKKAIEDGLALARELGDKEIIAIGTHNTAEYLAIQGNLTAAQQALEQAIALNKQRKSPASVAESQISLAEVFLELEQPARSAQIASEAAATTRRLRNAPLELNAQLALARAALAQRRFPVATEALARAKSLISASATPNQRLKLAICAARINSAAGNSSLGSLQAALNELGTKSTFQTRFEARLALAEFTAASSGAASARPLLDAIEKEATEQSLLLYSRKAAALRKS